MKLILKSIIFLVSGILFSQNEILNRKSYLLKLPINEKQFYKQNIKESPYFIKENVLQIFNGEKLFIEIETKKDTINSMRVVQKNLNPEKTIEVKLSQTLEGRMHKTTMLELKNPFKSDLEYKAVIAIFGVKKWINTNVHPVKSKLTSFEIWPDPIITLILQDWTFKK